MLDRFYQNEGINLMITTASVPRGLGSHCSTSVPHGLPISSCRGCARFMNVRDGKGATPLHLAARQRQPECVHVLLENGALVNASTGTYGRITYTVAIKHKHSACAALLNPSEAEPLVWPSPLKFIRALMVAKREGEEHFERDCSLSTITIKF